MTETLRIAQFITQYPYPNQFEEGRDYYCAGAARVAQELSEELVRRGHEVHVFTAAAGRKYEQEVQNGVVVHRSPSITAINTTQIAPSILFDHIQEYDFDIIHAHNSTPPGMLGAYVKSKIDGTPMVITHHGGEHYESHGGIIRRGGLFLYTRVLLHLLFSHASMVVIPSSGYIEESRVLSNPGINVTRIRNGVSIQEFDIDMTSTEAKQALGLDPDQYTVLYMGTHHKRKGPDLLVKAFAELTKEIDDAKLVMGGSGTLTDSLRRDAEELGIADKVDFPGYVPEEQKRIYLKAADVFVLPSTTGGSEMFPLAILEAAAASTPVVTSNFGTLRPIINDYNIGKLIEPGSVQSLAETLASLSDPDSRAEYQANAYQMAVDHSWEEITKEYLALFQQLVE